MAIAFSLEPEPYVPKEDREKDENGEYKKDERDRTTFWLGNLSHQQWGRLMNRIGGKDGDTINLIGSAASDILRDTLTGWDNFRDAQGREITFLLHGGKNMDKNLDRIPAGLRMELAMEVIHRNKLTETDEKN